MQERLAVEEATSLGAPLTQAAPRQETANVARPRTSGRRAKSCFGLGRIPARPEIAGLAQRLRALGRTPADDPVDAASLCESLDLAFEIVDLGRAGRSAQGLLVPEGESFRIAVDPEPACG